MPRGLECLLARTVVIGGSGSGSSGGNGSSGGSNSSSSTQAHPLAPGGFGCFQSPQQPTQAQQRKQHRICWGGALTETGGVLTLLQQQAQPQRNQQQQL